METTPLSKSGTIGGSLADDIFADLSSFNDVEFMEKENDSAQQILQQQQRPQQPTFNYKDSFSVNEARVAVVAERTRALIVSHACTNSTKAHAVLKISLNDTKHRKVIPVNTSFSLLCLSLGTRKKHVRTTLQVHSDCVRDVKVREDMLLTCSLDATLRVTDLRTLRELEHQIQSLIYITQFIVQEKDRCSNTQNSNESTRDYRYGQCGLDVQRFRFWCVGV